MTTASLRLLVTNAFGLLSKLGEFQNNLSSTKPDIAIVTETKFTPDKVPLTRQLFLAMQHLFAKTELLQAGA